MPAAQSPTLIHQYSAVYTRLQEGKRELIGFGIDRVLLNRYVLDSADSTNQNEPDPVLATIDLEKVTEGGNNDEKKSYCRELVASLIGLQEEVNTLQKVAREKGVGAGLLAIVGQASVQSPKDHGASVIRQLDQLLNGIETPTDTAEDKKVPAGKTSVSDTVNVLTGDAAANDPATLDFERLSSLQKIVATLFEHKSAIIVDVVVCLFASCLAIKLVS